MGVEAGKIADAAEEMGRPIPEMCIPPDVPYYLEPYIDHFFRLSSCRGMIAPGYPGPIPWTAVDAYAQRIGDPEDEIWYCDFICYMDHMDSVYLEHCMKKAGENNGNGNTVGSQAPPSRSRSSRTGW